MFPNFLGLSFLTWFGIYIAASIVGFLGDSVLMGVWTFFFILLGMIGIGEVLAKRSIEKYDNK